MARPALHPHLELSPRTHPDPAIARAGFDLDHPYLEQCWAPTLGPSAVLLLRRLPGLWQASAPAVVDTDDFARSLGLGTIRGANSRFARTLERLVHNHLADWTTPGGALTVPTTIAPLSEHALERAPASTRAAHQRLLTEHLDRLAQPPNPVSPSSVEGITARLDRLQRPRPDGIPALGR